jgi:hypothetical protein
MAASSFALLADAITVLHAAWAAWIVLMVPALWWGHWRRCVWARDPVLRLVHLGGMLIVPLEDALGVPCPLTWLERHFRARGGQVVYDGDFLAHAAHTLLYFRAPGWLFVALHVGFALVVVVTFWRIPPRWRARGSAHLPGVPTGAP